MKRIYMFMLVASVSIQATNPYCDYNRFDTQTKRDHDIQNATIMALFLGAGSGALCRLFEKRFLQDAFLLRCTNLLIWGIVQSKYLNTISTELTNQQIPHSPELMKRLAWVASWITYLLVDEVAV